VIRSSARIFRKTSLNLMLDYQPEDHDRKDDDAAITLFSMGDGYAF
jgi:hypothetical protein